MLLPKERIHYLLEAYISKRATAMEENELIEWILEAGEDSELKNYILEIWNGYNSTEDLSYVNWNEMYSRIKQLPVGILEPKVRKMRKMRWFRLTAAAAAFIVLAAGSYIYFTPATKEPIANSIQPKQIDIAPPSGNKAVLTLSNGTKIGIDSIGDGMIALQGDVRIIKQSNGEITYAGSDAKEVSYNKLDVPRGSKPLGLTLSDGSRVWLNVGSSLTYPTAFTGKQRKVKISGEAYFEIAHNAKMPFIVQHDDVSISVLGTHFNVNTYEDETTELITLLEGSVRVNKNLVSQLLKPGQQASITDKINDIKVLNNVNMDEVVAWKKGKFMFGEDTDIIPIMRQISRWYNVDIEYKGRINQRFWGSISKDVNVSRVLEILEATGGVKFKVEGNKIMVMPATP
jgi:transmembrane sensor